ncbi:MAG: hypothetical protein A2V78_04385 [Betaproteobacteria bacterium RBG_16_64_18]|nr:MAG: hypothetical protein A2V78_04385 [Betaproteobacteria bacterium RBG_16_64_18]OGA10572.1 MAG: hypothetical protein A3H33_08215 [Betaproteobacteria bacterium RIFCSPLOWO2_02_FULL_65_20]OGA38278.1 MAG: hypothetical protein A3G26_02300 [Betaproteobacteria bacterium RIFCSPLOWO2_12_FULL_65_110]
MHARVAHRRRGLARASACAFAERRTGYALAPVAIIRQGSDIPAAAALDYVAARSLGPGIALARTRGPQFPEIHRRNGA